MWNRWCNHHRSSYQQTKVADQGLCPFEPSWFCHIHKNHVSGSRIRPCFVKSKKDYFFIKKVFPPRWLWIHENRKIGSEFLWNIILEDPQHIECARFFARSRCLATLSLTGHNTKAEIINRFIIFVAMTEHVFQEYVLYCIRKY